MTSATAQSPPGAVRASAGDRLLAAATAVESTLPAPKAPPGTFFRLEDKAFVRSRREFAVSARMDHIAGVWVVSCDSNCDDWKSGAQRCPGAFSAEQALDWAEQLWACHRQRAAPAALSASDFIRVYVGSHAPLPLHAVTLA